MQEKQETKVSSNLSIINHHFLTSDATSMIAVYGHKNSTTVYIETGYKEQRSITKYQILFPNHSYASDAATNWTVSTPSISQETAAEIRKLRKASHTTKELQVSNDDMQSFKTTMDNVSKQGLILNGEQEDDIEQGLKAIGKTITFSQPSSCCLIS